MKKKLARIFTFQVLAVLMCTVQIYAQGIQQNGNKLSAVFGSAPSNKKPVLLKRLGTSPQFGEIPQHTAKSAYDHLKKVHNRNLKNSRNEIDNFLTVLGYSGFNDPAFTADKIVPIILPKGKVGWMGAYSRGHQYKWSVLGNPFPSFKILTKDGFCHAYIMKKCGNAFYDPAEQCVVPEVKCPDCVTQQVTFSGTGSIKAGDVVNTTQKLPIVANYNGKKLCIGEQTVGVRLTYELTADGKVDYTKTVQVPTYATNAPTSLNMPVLLSYDITESNISFADGGILNMPLTKKQYNKMKKLYSDCTVNTDTQNTTIVADRVAEFSQASSSPVLSGKKATSPDCTIKQTLALAGNGNISDVSANSVTPEVTIIGRYIKAGKLKKGETADKYRCLGSYSLPANTQIKYNVAGTSKIEHILEVCKDENLKANESISVPMTLNTQFTKQELMVGDYGKIYVPLTKKEYKRLSKVYQRCCGDGGTKCF